MEITPIKGGPSLYRFYGHDHPDYVSVTYDLVSWLNMPVNEHAGLYVTIEVHHERLAASKYEQNMSDLNLASFIRQKYKTQSWFMPRADQTLDLGMRQRIEKFVNKRLGSITVAQVKRYRVDAKEIVQTQELKTRQTRSDKGSTHVAV